MSSENRHQDEITVRRRLEGTLRAKFDETTWERLRYAARDYLDGHDDWESLKQWAEEALAYQRAHERELRQRWGMSEEPKGGGEQLTDSSEGSEPGPYSASFVVELSEREQKRTAVLLEIQMRQAAKHPDVERFRSERLAGQLLSAEEAETWFTPGARWPADEELTALGRRLERDYGWHQENAIWFVLTGDPPALRPLAADFFMRESIYAPNYCVLTLRVAPWIPAEEVKRTFLRMRDQVRGGSGPGTVSERRLEVLRFVEEKHTRSPRPTSAILLEMWNQRYPQWSYSDYRAFLKTYREARREVLYPRYYAPRREKTPTLERREARRRKFLDELSKKSS